MAILSQVRKREQKCLPKSANIKSVKVSAVEKIYTCGIDCLNLAETAHVENDSVREEENANGNDSK